MINELGKKSSQEDMGKIILEICKWKPHKIEELAKLLNRDYKHLLRVYIKPLKDQNKLQYMVPDMPNHPEQAYKTVV